MGYPKSVVEAARKKFEDRKKEYEQRYSSRKEAMYKSFPEIESIDRELSLTGVKIAKITLSRNGDPEKLIDELKKENNALIARKKELEKENGIFANIEKERYFCSKCEDTGYVENNKCECFVKLIKAEMCERLNGISALKLCSFDNFSLSYYSGEKTDGVSPKKVMANILEECKKYAKEFSKDSGNILMQGATGLGKTHLSLSIAKKVIENGYGVIYCSAHNIFDTMENERFSRTGEDREETLNAVLQCDLLIIDDLGAEYTTQFAVAEANNIINTRLLMGRPTIISTNLSLKEIEKKYGARFLSRVVGEYNIMRFAGNDIRLAKARGKQ